MPPSVQVRVTRLPVNPRMQLTDVNGVRLVNGNGSRAATRDLESLLWTWDIAVHNGRKQKKRTLRGLVIEVVDKCSDDVLLKTPTQIVTRLLGTRSEWSVAEVANLLLCTLEHVYALKQARALAPCSRKGETLKFSRATMERFLSERLVNK